MMLVHAFSQCDVLAKLLHSSGRNEDSVSHANQQTVGINDHVR